MNPLFRTDSYKVSHKGFMEPEITKVYSNLTARSTKHFNMYIEETVFFGLQAFIKEFLIKDWNKNFFLRPKAEVIAETKRMFDAYLGKDSVDMSHFEQLHDLGYLPIEIKALDEGTLVPIKVPYLTITNTHPDFAWLTNYLETLMSAELWKPITTATSTYYNRLMVNAYALATTGSLKGTEFQVHDFCLRGMSGSHDGAINGMAFLLSSNGTDNIPAIAYTEKYYNANIEKEFVGTSVPASEHSIACAATAIGGELEAYRKWITQDYPTGIVSLVSDTYDYFKVLTEYLPQLKEDILNRPANELGLSKVVIRPDSGNPVNIVCGYNCFDLDNSIVFRGEDKYRVAEWAKKSPNEIEAIKYCGQYWSVENPDLQLSEAEVKGSVEILWDIFGGETNQMGYRELDSHIGLIYGDGIDRKTALDILKRLEEKRFATTNIVFGFGSYSVQYVTRDSLGMAVKATAIEHSECGIIPLFKDPKTDDGMKKSAKGLLKVVKVDGKLTLLDNVSAEEEKEGELKTVFKNGVLVEEHSFSEIRNRLWGEG